MAGRKAALFAVDGLINKEIIALSVMEPLLKTQDYPPAPQAMLAHIERAVLSAAELKHERDLEKLLTLLMSGFVLLCVDGCDDGLVSGVQGFAYRGPQEPQNEVMQRGAKDGFTESNQLNMAMILSLIHICCAAPPPPASWSSAALPPSACGRRRSPEPLPPGATGRSSP